MVVVYLVLVMNTKQRQVAAYLWTKPTSLSYKSTCRQLVKEDLVRLCRRGYGGFWPVLGGCSGCGSFETSRIGYLSQSHV